MLYIYIYIYTYIYGSTLYCIRNIAFNTNADHDLRPNAESRKERKPKLTTVIIVSVGLCYSTDYSQQAGCLLQPDQLSIKLPQPAD